MVDSLKEQTVYYIELEKLQGLSEHSFKIKLDGENMFSTYNLFKKGEMNDAFKSLEYFIEKEEGSKNV